MDDILEFDNVCLKYQSQSAETLVLNNLSFSVKYGEFVSIIGPSGCGKTTVLSLIAGLIKSTGGKIIYKGSELNRVFENIGYMLQRDELFPWRTIEKNVFLPLEIKKITGDIEEIELEKDFDEEIIEIIFKKLLTNRETFDIIYKQNKFGAVAKW